MTIARNMAPPCDNRNHLRTNAPVRHCPQCSGVVNVSISPRQCTESEHAAMRRPDNKFCIHCGIQLVFLR